MEKVVENLPQQNIDLGCCVYLLFYTVCMRNKFKIKRELLTDKIVNYRSRLGNVVEHQSKHEKERRLKNDWLNISAKMLPRYSYNL